MQKGIVIMIVLILVFGFLFYLNSPVKYDLTKKYGLTGKVINFYVYDIKNQTKILENFEETYFQYKAKDKQVYLVIANANDISLISYENYTQGKLSLSLSDIPSEINIEKLEMTKTIFPKKDKIELIINGEKLELKLKKGQNAYLIIEDGK